MRSPLVANKIALATIHRAVSQIPIGRTPGCLSRAVSMPGRELGPLGLDVHEGSLQANNKGPMLLL